MITKVAIIGCGKMGSFLAKELAKENGTNIAVYDNDSKRAELVAKETNTNALHTIEEISSFAPDLLINAVSLQNTIKAFEEVVRYLPKSCVIGDVASVKRGLEEFYNKSGFKFCSVHPMFGPTFATMDSLKEENAVLIKESDPETKEFFRNLFTRLGVKIFEYTFAEHDQMMAYSLTTPFASSLVFASCMDKTAVPGTTFKRHKTIAKGLLSEDDHLLAEILFNSYSLAQLEKITNRLEFLKHVIKAKDYEEAKRFFDKLRKNIG
ncbi:MAG: prephenate dehydrogenase/arogenate dehydrogenase family protein [Candidatus Micrarchaeota archaeon]